MPCHDPWAHKEDEQRMREELIAKIDMLTQMLCFICGNLEMHPSVGKSVTHEGIRAWWRDHESSDRTRIESQMFQELVQFPSNAHPDPATLTQWYIDKAAKEHPVSKYHREVWFPARAIEAISRIAKKIEMENNNDEKRRKALSKLTDDDLEALGLTPDESEKEWPKCEGCGEPVHPMIPCDEAKALREE